MIPAMDGATVEPGWPVPARRKRVASTEGRLPSIPQGDAPSHVSREGQEIVEVFQNDK